MCSDSAAFEFELLPDAFPVLQPRGCPCGGPRPRAVHVLLSGWLALRDQPLPSGGSCPARDCCLQMFSIRSDHEAMSNCDRSHEPALHRFQVVDVDITAPRDIDNITSVRALWVKTHILTLLSQVIRIRSQSRFLPSQVPTHGRCVAFNVLLPRCRIGSTFV